MISAMGGKHRKIADLNPEELELRRQKEREKKQRQRERRRDEINLKQKEVYARNRERNSQRKSVRYYRRQGVSESSAIILSTIKSEQRKKPRGAKLSREQIRKIFGVINKHAREGN